jgi:probable rRNA maturation factor
VRYRIYLRIAPAFKRALAPTLLRAAARAALTHADAPPGELTIVVTDDAELQRLNRDYLGYDATTDVLSFPAEEIDPETGARYLGDIALSLPRARAQAKAGGHPLKAEVQLLIVHGVLHLLGHDHAGPDGKARMWAAQAEILRALQSPITGPAT